MGVLALFLHGVFRSLMQPGGHSDGSSQRLEIDTAAQPLEWDGVGPLCKVKLGGVLDGVLQPPRNIP